MDKGLTGCHNRFIFKSGGGLESEKHVLDGPTCQISHFKDNEWILLSDCCGGGETDHHGHMLGVGGEGDHGVQQMEGIVMYYKIL